MEALEEDVTREMAVRRTERGGELYECWKMLRVLLRAAYLGRVGEDEDENETSGEGTESGSHGEMHAATTTTNSNVRRLVDIPQDRPMSMNLNSSPAEVNVMEVYDAKKFSMVHAAASVWECPPPLAKLVLKCLCGKRHNSTGDFRKLQESYSNEDGEYSKWDPNATTSAENSSYDPIRTPDEENMRLPLHIAVCACPQDRSDAKVKHWLSSSEVNSVTRGMIVRRPSNQSLAGGASSGASVTSSLATRPGIHRQPQVYNPRFGRSRSRDGMRAFTTFPNQNSFGSSHGSHHDENSMAHTAGSSVSMMGGEESFLQHTMVRDVLALYPAGAAVVDTRTGKLPIVLAVENGKSWAAVGPLLDAFPKPFAGDGDGGMALPDGELVFVKCFFVNCWM